MILVTGGTGLVGSHLLHELVKTDSHIRAIIRTGSHPGSILPLWKYYSADAETLFKKIEWYSTDLMNRAAIAEAINGWEKIFHCAGSVSFSRRRKNEIRETNIIMVRNLIDACLENNTGKFIHVSSVAAIAKPEGNGPADESSGFPVKPGSLYAKSKTLGELEVWRGISEGLNAVIVNPSVILGPAVNKMGSTMLFSSLRKGMSFYPSGSTGFVDVRDVAGIMVRLADSDISGERFVLNSANMAYRELFTKILSGYSRKPPKFRLSKTSASLAALGEWFMTLFTGKEPRITLATARSSASHHAYSAEKVRSTLGVTFRDIDETIRDTADYYRTSD